MKKGFLYLLLSCFISCNQFATKKVDEQELVEKELQTINWNEVDQYPSFATCNELTGKETLKNCFVSKVGQTILNNINPAQKVVSATLDETVMLKLEVSEEGELTLIDAIIPEIIHLELPKIDSLLRASVREIENVQPALKRGQPVKTTLKLPIRIKTE